MDEAPRGMAQTANHPTALLLSYCQLGVNNLDCIEFNEPLTDQKLGVKAFILTCSPPVLDTPHWLMPLCLEQPPS